MIKDQWFIAYAATDDEDPFPLGLFTADEIAADPAAFGKTEGPFDGYRAAWHELNGGSSVSRTDCELEQCGCVNSEYARELDEAQRLY